MKVKELLNKFKEMEVEDLTILLQFIEIISNLSKEEQEVVEKLFNILEKAIDKNFVRRKK